MDYLNRKQCSLCSRNQAQVSTILTQLQEKLQRMLKISQIEQGQDKQNSKNPQGFYRLIRVIFCNKFKHLKANMNCRHQQIKKYLLKKLKCSNQVFNSKCDELAGILGKFNFHVDTLIQQMKGFQRYLKTQRNENSSINGDLKQDNQQIQKLSDQFQLTHKKSQQNMNEVKQEQKQLNFGPQIPTLTSYSHMDANIPTVNQNIHTFPQNQFIYPINPINYIWFYEK